VNIHLATDQDDPEALGTLTTQFEAERQELVAIIARLKRQVESRKNCIGQLKTEVEEAKQECAEYRTELEEKDIELEEKEGALQRALKDEIQYRNWWLNEIQFTKLLLNKIPNPNRDIELVRESQAHYLGHY
jgi:chromosome segregation ATPase